MDPKAIAEFVTCAARNYHSDDDFSHPTADQDARNFQIAASAAQPNPQEPTEQVAGEEED